jgi:hypothetical protein
MGRTHNCRGWRLVITSIGTTVRCTLIIAAIVVVTVVVLLLRRRLFFEAFILLFDI